ncbi:thiamine biosynthesis protein ThiF [Actinomyces howellii]|uniref:Bacteriocin biosynthesis cyclodehydratase domain n=1 Tax=Actinomyces howellii TaxID=52771 RepID=A0A448HKI4_9ACTO|nr:thiamine biosynthesis protein ThiF [Actinomyces howellii]VEG30079.1 bacteriocin biosynthesis cyclodehydratase domain [Actinomyces howellii]
MRIRGQSPVLWRAPGQTQVGAEPGHAVVLEGLSPAEQRLLDHLPAVISAEDVYRTARWTKVPMSRAREVLGLLREAGALAEDDAAPSSADEIYWDRLTPRARERTTLLRSGVVAVLGAGWLAQAIIGLLAEAGVGTILPDDEDLELWTSRVAPKVSTRAPLGCRPDLVVSVEGHVVDPVRARELDRADLVHLPVLARDVSVRVGPLLVPGRGACSTCLGLWDRDADPCWPAVATQLRLLGAPVLERLLIHQAAALAARGATDVVVGAEEAWLGRSIEVSAADPLGVERTWPPHPECLCGQVPSSCSPSPTGSVTREAMV